MNLTIQGASSHTQGVGCSLAHRVPGANPESGPEPVPLSLLALGQTPSPGHYSLVRTLHMAASWESGTEILSPGFSLDSESVNGGS